MNQYSSRLLRPSHLVRDGSCPPSRHTCRRRSDDEQQHADHDHDGEACDETGYAMADLMVRRRLSSFSS